MPCTALSALALRPALALPLLLPAHASALAVFCALAACASTLAVFCALAAARSVLLACALPALALHSLPSLPSLLLLLLCFVLLLVGREERTWSGRDSIHALALCFVLLPLLLPLQPMGCALASMDASAGRACREREGLLGHELGASGSLSW